MYLDDLLREIETTYDHAYLGAYDDSVLEKVTQQWLDTPGGQVAWDHFKSGIPAFEIVAGEFEDEIQVWLLQEWEAYLEGDNYEV